MMDILKLAREAQLMPPEDYKTPGLTVWGAGPNELQHFANLILEEAAKVCDGAANELEGYVHDGRGGAATKINIVAAVECAERIRALKVVK